MGINGSSLFTIQKLFCCVVIVLIIARLCKENTSSARAFGNLLLIIPFKPLFIFVNLVSCDRRFSSCAFFLMRVFRAKSLFRSLYYYDIEENNVLEIERNLYCEVPSPLLRFFYYNFRFRWRTIDSCITL